MSATECVIVFGPQACGKTRHAAALARHFGCPRVQDDWDGLAPLQPGALVLTHVGGAEAPPGVRRLDYAVALREAGLCA